MTLIMPRDLHDPAEDDVTALRAAISERPAVWSELDAADPAEGSAPPLDVDIEVEWCDLCSPEAEPFDTESSPGMPMPVVRRDLSRWPDPPDPVAGSQLFDIVHLACGHAIAMPADTGHLGLSAHHMHAGAANAIAESNLTEKNTEKEKSQ